MTIIDTLRACDILLTPYKIYIQKTAIYPNPYRLAVAMSFVESSGDKFSSRFEPNFKKNIILPNLKRLLIDSNNEFEIIFRSTSWGLFQIMGQVIRENKIESDLYKKLDMKPRPIYEEEFMNNIETQVKLYVKIMNKNWNRYFHSVTKEEDMIAAYNAGSARRGLSKKYKNQDYVDKVNTTITNITVYNGQKLLSV